MTPPKAIIILLILLLFIAAVFAAWYINNKPPADNGYNISAGSTNQEELSPEQQKIKAIEDKTNQQVEQIVERGKTAAGGITPDAQRKIEEAVNLEIMEKINFRTPEQLKADEQRQAELEEIERQINQQIKSRLQSK